MQTIDLGTISIGGEDLGAPQTPGTHAGPPFPVSHAGGIASRPPPSHRPRQSSASPLYVNPPVLRRPPANRFPGKRPAPALPKNTAKNAALSVPATTTSISKNARTTRSVTLETPSWRDRAVSWTLPCA